MYGLAMIDHTGIRVSDLDKSIAFYTKALAPLGYTLLAKFPGGAGFGANNKPDFCLDGSGKPPNDQIHVAFRASGRQIVRDFYAAAMAAGASRRWIAGTGRWR